MVNKWMVLLVLVLPLGVHSSLNAQGKPTGAPVEIVPVTKESVEKQVTLIGTVFPLRKSVLASEVEGLVKRLFVEEGSFVKKGDRIAELGSSVYELELKEAEAARKETEQRYLQAQSDLERSADLLKKGFVPEKQLLDDRFRTDALLKRLQQHEAEMDRLKDALRKTNVPASFSGEVVKKHTEVGQWVNKGGPVVTLIDLSRVHVMVSVPERYVFRLKVGQPAFVTADALAGRTYEGTIYAIISEGDAEARTFPVKFEVVNKGFKLKSGMLARVTFSTGYPRKGLLVPKDALVNQGQAVVVFVVEDGMARQVPVRVEGYHGNKAEVTGRVRAGDPVVVRGNERLRDGQPVQAFPAPGQT